MTRPPEPSLALLAIRMIGRLRSHHIERLAGFRLSIPEANVLLHLQPGEPMTMRHLAEVMGYDKSNLTGVMGKLEARGLVARNGSPATAERDRCC
jgi:DNA-binding MarR family transcriptional regulator